MPQDIKETSDTSKAAQEANNPPRPEIANQFYLLEIFESFKREQSDKMKSLEEKIASLTEENKRLMENYSNIPLSEEQKKKIHSEKVRKIIAALPEVKSRANFNRIRIISNHMVFFHITGQNDDEFMKLNITISPESTKFLEELGFVVEKQYATSVACLSNTHVELGRKEDYFTFVIVSDNGENQYGYYSGKIDMDKLYPLELTPNQSGKIIL